MDVSVQLSECNWLLILEQSLMLLLVIGRWLLPKGDITRDELSQLLLGFIGMASDIMELFVLFDETAVVRDKTLSLVILITWSGSLLQFCAVMTSQPRKVHPEIATEARRKYTACNAEILGLLMAAILQDIPFFAIRVYVMVVHQLLNYTIVFFSIKNALVISLQVYRLVAICLNDDRKQSVNQRTVNPEINNKQTTDTQKKDTEIMDIETDEQTE